MKKKCSKCDTEKLLTEYSKDKRASDGLYGVCRMCRKVWYERNKDKVKDRARQWYQENKERARDYQRYEKDKSKIRDGCRKWREKNKDKMRLYQREYTKARRRTDIKFHLDTNISSAISDSLKGKKGRRRWRDLVGYNIESLIEHLERQFDDKMSWQNYGSYWHLDHRTPMSWFKYKFHEDEEFKKCWALENLQPLEAKANLRKHNSYAN